MNHLSLFSGIGGFELAASWAWPDHRVTAFVEKDKFCQQVLARHWPGVPIYDDIKQFNGMPWRGTTDLVTGGFPCQPFSAAGKREGANDDRFLWPEAIRVIGEVQPRWIVLENVAGIFSILEPDSISQVERQEVTLFCENDRYPGNAVIERVQRRVIARIIEDIRQAEYRLPELADGTPIIPCIPACAVNAPHRRDRIWLIACASNSQCQQRPQRAEIKRRAEQAQQARAGREQLDSHADSHIESTSAINGNERRRQLAEGGGLYYQRQWRTKAGQQQTRNKAANYSQWRTNCYPL